ncbi:MAG: helix-turn-helix transcriptional regulator [Pararhodobacter sp.]|nr:helix-turn-helix transcriptional regulator [Pararhodobacter sp.]
MDKRQAAARFRERLAALQAGAGLTQTALATAIGIDRSALSQLTSGANPRLPRAETVISIARHFHVSADWLLGLSEDRGTQPQALTAVETEAALDAEMRTAMERWHAEAAGQKVRYVPAHLPDLMRTEAVIAFQAQASEQERRRLQSQTRTRLHFSRMPESDIETCMPMQALELFARGQGIWRGLAARHRAEQRDHIAATLEMLYPAFRLYLFDGRSRFAPPMTLFGYTRAAVYTGEHYLHIRSRALIHDLAHGFDSHIRHAAVHAHEAAEWVRALPVPEL